MKKAIQLFLGLTTLSIVAVATPAPKKGKEITYKVDTQQSKLSWTGKKVTGEHTGLAPISQGILVFDGQKLTGGTFDIDLKSLTVTDITDADKNAKLVGHLKDDDFFAVNKYPTAKFILATAQPTGNGRFEVSGKLTIKGITHELKFPVQLKTDNGKLVAAAKITINRTNYGIRYGSKSFFENIGDKAISDDFTLDVSLVANRG